jgi:GntR family transcriptional regulator
MLIRVDPTAPAPLADQIAAQVRACVMRGEVAAGGRLPPARELAAALDVNMHTVLRAYAQLRDEGLIELRQGRGAVVRGDIQADHARLTDLARQFVAQARRLGLDAVQMDEMIRKARS